MTNREHDIAVEHYLTRRTDRRRFLQLGALGASSIAMGSLLAACGDGDEDEPTAVAADPTAPSGAEPTAEEAEGEQDEPTAEGESEPTATDDEGSGDAAGPRVIIAQGVDIATFDPHEDTSSSAIAIFTNVFDNLVARNQELELVPSIAESWESIDETTWEFSLRNDVVFHDGTPATANDVQWAFQHVLDPDVGSRQQTNVAMIETVEAIDDYKVRIITNIPFPPLLTVLNNVYVLPAEMYQEMGAEKFALNPVGTGPYRFVEWVKDQQVVLERFDDHWRGAPAIGEAEFRPIPEASTRVASLTTGEIHVATLVPVTDVPTVEGSETSEIRSVRSNRTIFVGMNTWEGPLSDVRVRQALNYGVNVNAIVELLLNGFGYPLASVSGPNEFGFNPDLEPYPYDPERAKELLAEAGYADGFDTVLDTPSGRYLQDVEVSQAIAGQLAEIGVNVEVRPAEFQEYFTRWLAEEMEGLYFLGVGGSAMDADGVMGSHFDSERRGLYYNSPESDELIQEAMSEFDEDEREALYHELMAYLKEQAPWIFLYSQEDIYGVASNLNWEPQPDESLWVYDMSWS